MLEREIRDKISKAIKRKYPTSKLYKIHGSPYQERGIPDLVGCINGRFVALEVKRPGEKPTKYQENQLQAIGTAGGVTGVVTSELEALKLVSENL